MKKTAAIESKKSFAKKSSPVTVKCFLSKQSERSEGKVLFELQGFLDIEGCFEYETIKGDAYSLLESEAP